MVTVDDDDLMDVFARVARSFAAMEDVQSTLQQIVNTSFRLFTDEDPPAP